MFPTNSERLIGISDAFSAFVYGYPSSCPHAHCTPNKSVPTLRYTRRPGPVYTGHACRHLPSAVPWISEDRLLLTTRITKDNGANPVYRLLNHLFFCFLSPMLVSKALCCWCCIEIVVTLVSPDM